MSRPIIRPWRDLAELLAIRRLLYPDDAIEREIRNDNQRLGVYMVNTWKRRCRVPHSIYSTAVLVDAKLHHDVATASTVAIRTIHSSAIARFVTGFCDIGQNSVVKRSMFEVAELIGMPEAWVELRHEITHGQIPDLRTLEKCVDDSLIWLWEFFWSRMSAPGADDVHDPRTEDEMREILKSCLRSRLNEIKIGQIGTAISPCAASASRQLLRFIKESDSSMATLIAILLEQGMMLTSHKQSGMDMKVAAHVWDGFLKAIASNKPEFLPKLVTQLLNELNTPSTQVLNFDELQSAIFLWLVHLTTSRGWKKMTVVSQRELLTQIAETCLLTPTILGHKLVKAILVCADDDLQQFWGPLYDAASLEENGDIYDLEVSRSIVDSICKSDDDCSDASGTRISFDGNAEARPVTSGGQITTMAESLESSARTDQSSLNSGWRLWEGGWVPRPIGM